jgi:rare lipoprotein A
MKKIILFLVGCVCYFLSSAQVNTVGKANSKFESSELFDMFLRPSNKILFGIASFYSRHLEGTLTATGERFFHHSYTAASNDFPLGTYVRVTNLENNKSIVVRINDRMHTRMQKQGRVVDLPIDAAKELGFIKQGLTKVKVEAVSPPIEPAQ